MEMNISKKEIDLNFETTFINKNNINFCFYNCFILSIFKNKNEINFLKVDSFFNLGTRCDRRETSKTACYVEKTALIKGRKVSCD